MKVTKEKTESCQAFLTIEMEPSEVEESLEKAYHRLVKRANIPGFRKGKAPRLVLERHVGREHLLENALDSLIPEAYEKAFKEQGIEPIAQPQIEVRQTEPVVFKVIVPLKPNVKLGDYHHLKVVSSTVEEVTEAQIDAAMEELRHQHANWETVDRSADFGDWLVVDVEGSVEDKKLIDQKSVPYQLRRNSSMPMPGFAEQLVGMKKDGVKEFQIKLPADYLGSDLAGKEASFKVKVSDVNQEILPELNDQFAGIVNPDFKTLADLRQYITADWKRSAEEGALQKFEEKVVNATVGVSEVEFPPILVEAEINQILNQRFPRGQEEMETYLRSINKTVEAFHQGLHTLAVSRVTHSLVLTKVSEEEKIEVSDAEIDTEIENITINAVENKEETRKVLNTPQNRESVKNRLIARKTVQRLVEIAQSSAETKTAETKTVETKTTGTETAKKTVKKEEGKK